MTKKSLLLMLSLVLALTIGLGSTLAYLTDTDAEVNTFTIGDVDIELDEEYEQDQPINPGVEVDKIVKIKNVSENEAWVWYTVAIPVAGDGENAAEVIIPTYNEETDKWTKLDKVQALEIEGELYNVYTYLWNEKLAGGAETAEGLQKIQMHPGIDYDPVSGTYKFIDKGEEVGSIDYDLTAGKVYVNAFAIQTEGFDTIDEAYAGFMGQWTDGNGYTEEMINVGSVEIPVRTLWSDNADTAWYDKDAANYTIDTAEELAGLAVLVNEEGVNFSGKTVTLTADVDMGANLWTPIGQTGATEFKGVFDGGENTISNLIVNSDDQTGANYASGLFGWIESHAQDITIKNVNVDGAKVSGHHYCAVIAGYMEGDSVVENCSVTNATVSCTYANDAASGDKAGAIVGYAAGEVQIKNCTVSDTAIDAGRDAGQLVGAAKTAVVDGTNSATNVTVEENGTGTGANIREELIGRVL